MTCRQGRSIQPRHVAPPAVKYLRRPNSFWNSRFGAWLFCGGFYFSGIALAVVIVAAIAVLGDPGSR